MAQSWRARYSDGHSARSWHCDIRLEARGLAIDFGPGHDVLTWPYSDLHTPTPYARNSEMIVALRDAPGAQLFLHDAGAIDRLVRIAPQLTTARSRRGWLLPLLAVAGSIVAFVAALWYLDIRPARAVAGLLPDHVRQSIGRTVVEQFKAQGSVCATPDGRQALEKLMARLLRREPDARLFAITVVNLPFRNAFASAGGQMVITAKMIETSTSPDEVAGVLAHEIGHGIERHPDAAIVRALGLSLLLELFGSGSGILGNLAVGVLQTGYARQDERAADRQALRLLKQAGISQQGLETVFSSIAKEEGKSSGALDFLRTHPYANERIEVVRRSASYPATPALDDADWQALRTICKKPD